MKNKVWQEFYEKHPCYSWNAHHNYFRLHLPVATECNLGCNYCEKSIGGMTYHSYRPAVTDKILSPEEALNRVLHCMEKTNKLTVVGVAGPGEPLANEETFISLELVQKQFPEIILCLSTNGILVRDSIEKLKRLKICFISITINSLNLVTINSLYRHVYTSNNEKLTGIEAAGYIKRKQFEALKILSENFINFKVNTILIPGINDTEIEEIAVEISRHGARLHNIIPFIPLGKLDHLKAPSYIDLQRAREKSKKYLEQIHFCKQCRSDAFDIPGKVQEYFSKHLT